MTRFTSRALALSALFIVVAVALAGCGGTKSDDTATAPVKAAVATGQLTHVDGAITLDGSTLTLTPATGGDTSKFKLGPAVSQGTVQALVSASARARVFYQPSSKDSPTLAVAVEPAPSAGSGAKTYDGKVVAVSDTSITIAGKDGSKTFAIQAKDLPAFDVPHLNEHKAEKSPVRVYYRGTGEDAHAVAYEDA